MNRGLFGFPARSARAGAIEVPMLSTDGAIRADEYASSGTFTRITAPSGANFLTVLLYGGGGGGMSGGCKNTGTTILNGGGGGGGGGTCFLRYDLRRFPARLRPLYFTVVVGAGGAGGAGTSTDNTNGNGGTNGGNSYLTLTDSGASTVMTLGYAWGGTAASGTVLQRNGLGGRGMLMGGISEYSSGTGLRGQDGGGNVNYNSGSFGDPRAGTAYDIPNHPYVCGGGGSGGAMNTAGANPYAGRSGGAGFWFYAVAPNNGSGSGDAPDAQVSDVVFAGVGGGGGAANNAGNGCKGGAGVRGGGGGGGGGANSTGVSGTYASGAGGAGGSGYGLLVWEE